MRAALLGCALLCLLLLLSPRPASGIGKKLSDKDLAELEDQWFSDEDDDPNDLTRWHRGPDGQRQPPRQPKKSEMAFVALQRPISKDETSKWAAHKSDLLVTGGVDVKGYAVEAGKVLFVTDGGFSDMQRVQRFILRQDRVVDFEWNQKKSYPQQARRQDAAEQDEGDDEDGQQGAELDVEALLAKAQQRQQDAAPQPTAKAQQAQHRRAKQAKSAVKDDSYLGGAAGPIPAELPDD